MKRSVKISLIVIGIGLALIIIGTVVIQQRGKTIRIEAVQALEKVLPKIFPNVNISSRSLEKFRDDLEFEASSLSGESTELKLVESKTFSYSEISSIEFEINDSYDFALGTSYDGEFELEIFARTDTKHTISNSKGNLVVKMPDTSKWRLNKRYKAGEIKLLIPKDKQLDFFELIAHVGAVDIKNLACEKFTLLSGVGECIILELKTNLFKFDGGVGACEFEAINSKTAEITCGVGEINMKNCELGDTKISGGVGEITMSNCFLNNADIEGGIGEISFSGRLTGKSRASIGLGSVDIRIQDSKENYRIKYESGLGALNIPGRVGSKGVIEGENPQHDLQITGGLGELSLRFRD